MARKRPAESSTRLSLALTSGLLTRRDLRDADVAAALETLPQEACSREIASGTYGTTYRACQVLSTASPLKKEKPKVTCSACFVYKRARKAGRLPLAEATLQERLTGALTKAGRHGAAHIPRFIRTRPDPAPDMKRAGDVVLFMKDVRPIALRDGTAVATLWDLGTNAHAHKLVDLVWRSVWLQIIGTLAGIQDVEPSFQHNDLHGKNVLVSPGAMHNCLFRRPDGTRLSAANVPVVATIIDFGLATSDLAKPPYKGLDAYANCALLDVHHAAAAVYSKWVKELAARGYKTGDPLPPYLPAWFQPWALFLYRWLGQQAFDWSKWDRHDFPSDPAAMSMLRRRSAALKRGLRDLLADPYFDAFAAKGGTPRVVNAEEFAPSPKASKTALFFPRRSVSPTRKPASKPSRTTSPKRKTRSKTRSKPQSKPSSKPASWSASTRRSLSPRKINKS